MKTTYKTIAKNALIKWNGLSEKEANKKIEEETIEKLEEQVYALDSIKAAVEGISNYLNLSQEGKNAFLNAIINGPSNSQIFKIIKEKGRQIIDIEEFELSILTIIHNQWIINNSSEKTFYKKLAKKQLRQYTPLELIGWNEVKSDLIFLSPILSSIGIIVDENKLEDKYHEYVKYYLHNMNINNITKLEEFIKQGKTFYPILPEELSQKLIQHSNEVTIETISNWEENDKKTAIIFLELQKNIELEKQKSTKKHH